jgi:predicted regulator of Ras-like GTPase activity (Roadblock/LC7/MglB family)
MVYSFQRVFNDDVFNIPIYVERQMIKQLQNLLDQMSKELPGILAAAVVTVEDGMSIAEVRRREDIETAAAAAYLASIVKSNAKAIKLLADDEEIDDILITTRQYHFIIRHAEAQPFFIFVMTSKEEWLGKARMLIKKYELQFAGFAGYIEKNFQ